MGTPRKPIDGKMVYRLARIMCTDEEIATIFDVSVDTLTRRFKEELIRGRAVGKMSLRRLVWKNAYSGNLGAQVWLTKNLLGWKDRNEQTTEVKVVTPHRVLHEDPRFVGGRESSPDEGDRDADLPEGVADRGAGGVG